MNFPNEMSTRIFRRALVFLVMVASVQLLALGKESPMENRTFYRSKQIDGISIFYREAGPKDAPTLLLLHGLPSSSRMFEPLFARLSDRYHLVAPDYPGYGHSDWPDPKKFAYTFDHIAEIMNHFTEALGLSHFTLYMQDYGGPVGFRMALVHPERVTALIVQDAVAHNEGLGANWKTRRAFWADRAANEDALRTNLLSCKRRGRATLEAIRMLNGTTRTSGPMNFIFSISPDRRRFKATSSTITARMLRPTQSGRRGCARNSRGCSSSGESTICLSRYRNRKITGATCRKPKFMCSMPGTLRSTRLRTRSRSSSGAL
jgi:pimeloyl-ACP methyl ester carboxylesterase